MTPPPARLKVARRLRVAVYDPFTPGLGGLYRYVQGVLDGLTPDRFDVTLFCHPNRPFRLHPGVEVVPVHPYTGVPADAAGAAGTRGASPPPVDGPGARFPRRLVPGSALRVAGFVRSAWSVARLFRGRGFDVVHTYETDADPAVLAARFAGVPRVVYTFQVDSSYLPPAVRDNPGRRLTEMATDRCLSLGIAASEATRRDRLRRTHVGPARLVAIPNGIDSTVYVRTLSRAAARAATGLPDDGRLLLGTVGRLHEHKGQEYLLRALAELPPGLPPHAAVIVGSGELDAPLKALAAALGVADRVAFLGQRSDILPLLQSFDLFALPSVCEALPYALLEAMSVGLPCVATAVGGVSELIEDGRTGSVVPPRNPTALATALAGLLRSAELRATTGAAARDRVVAHFHEPALIARTVAALTDGL